MIAYLKGKIDYISPTIVWIECAGVGYEVNISLSTYTALKDKEECKILISPIYREDTQLLYGFASKIEQDLFLLLISVNGVGHNTARVILSSYPSEELASIIASSNLNALKTIKGIGAKTAQRILLDIKDKVIALDINIDANISSTKIESDELKNPNTDEAHAALKVLGYNDVAIRKVIKQIISKNPSATVEELIKQGLSML